MQTIEKEIFKIFKNNFQISVFQCVINVKIFKKNDIPLSIIHKSQKSRLP